VIDVDDIGPRQHALRTGLGLDEQTRAVSADDSRLAEARVARQERGGRGAAAEE
jgi:hypothetical protein